MDCKHQHHPRAYGKENKMICSKCNNQGVENHALGKPFWYCRTCKDEIVDQNLVEKLRVINTDELDAFFGVNRSPILPTSKPTVNLFKQID